MRYLFEISKQRRYVVNGLREIAARSGQGFDEGRSAQPPEMCQRIVTLMSGGTMGAMAVMQEKIFAAERGYPGGFQDPVGEEFVRGQRGCGGIVLRVP